MPFLVGQITAFRVCPLCIATEQMPIVSMFAAVQGCAQHRLKVVTTCRCGNPILPFRKQQPFRCHRCGAPYASLCAESLADDTLADCTRTTALLSDLLTLRLTPGAELNGRILRRVLTRLVRSPVSRSVDIDVRLLAKAYEVRGGTTLANFMEIYHATRCDVTTLRSTIEEVARADPWAFKATRGGPHEARGSAR